MHSARQVILEAFERLFEKAADKLDVSYTHEELTAARLNFEQRFAPVLDAIGTVPVAHVPSELVADMEKAIERLSPAQVAAHVASIPLMHQVQETLRVIARREAERRVLEHMLTQAEDQYGGN